VWTQIEAEDLGFMDFVEKHGLEAEGGDLFSYLARIMKFARVHEATQLED
jgi:hypothetical protein